MGFVGALQTTYFHEGGIISQSLNPALVLRADGIHWLAFEFRDNRLMAFFFWFIYLSPSPIDVGITRVAMMKLKGSRRVREMGGDACTLLQAGATGL